MKVIIKLLINIGRPILELVKLLGRKNSIDDVNNKKSIKEKKKFSFDFLKFKFPKIKIIFPKISFKLPKLKIQKIKFKPIPSPSQREGRKAWILYY